MALTEPTITDFDYRVLNRGIITPNMQPACAATLTFPNGDFLTVSRYDTEDAWVVDSNFKSNGYPVFSNGTGVRCTAPQRIKNDAPVVILLNKMRDEKLSKVAVS